jgi:hypothetical protein
MSDTELDDSSDYGIRGLEKAAGYKEMVLADAPAPSEELDVDAAREIHKASHETPVVVDREFRDVRAGELRPETETVSAEDAARNLSNVREAERQALADQNRRDLQQALDQLHGQELQPVAADNGRTAAEAQPYQPELDPQAIAALDPEQQNALYAANQAQIAEADRQIQEFLQNPVVRERIEGEFNQVKAQVDQAKAGFEQATAELATQAQGVLTALPRTLQPFRPAVARRFAIHAAEPARAFSAVPATRTAGPTVSWSASRTTGTCGAAATGAQRRPVQ